jgi:uncharacterized membrane protein YfcA
VKGLIASPLGALVGLMMGAFGGGGSLLAIPILVYVADQGPREAQATALVIVMAASISGLITYIRDDSVRWRMGVAFGLAAGVSAFAGSVLNRQLDPDVLLLAFSPVMLAGAWAMVSERAQAPATFTPWRFGVETGEVLRVVGLGLLVGWIVGLFGVGGGFVIVPVLVLVMHLSMVSAVGTSLLVIVIASSFALGDRLGTGDVDWAIAVPFSVAALIGAVAGEQLAQRVETGRLQKSFAVVIVFAAIYTAIRSALAIWG